MTRKEYLEGESSSDAANKKVNDFDSINCKIKRMTSIKEPTEENAEIVNNIQVIDRSHRDKKPGTILNTLFQVDFSTDPKAFSYLYQEESLKWKYQCLYQGQSQKNGIDESPWCLEK